ncbi:MAG: DUF1592 domain-containing protein [Planctomycetes bacterium]|nr:DUF1592 domain-containing protein [Planctomycetota bacterium]
MEAPDRQRAPLAPRAGLLGAVLAGALAAQGVSEPAPFAAADVQSFAARYCADCHTAPDPEADLDVPALLAATPTPALADDLLRVRDALRGGEMPPRAEPQPDAPTRARALAWVDGALAALAGGSPRDPGRVTLRRLSRYEYANTVRDLLGVDVDVRTFPADDLAYGFDNIGDALSVSTLHLEKYAAAAEDIALRAFPDEDADVAPVGRIDADHLRVDGAARNGADAVVMVSRGTATAELALPRAGRYVLRVLAWAQQAGPELARMEVEAGARRRTFDVRATDGTPEACELEVDLAAPRLTARATFVNDYYDPENPDPRQRDRNLFVVAFEIVGPLDRRAPTLAEQRFLADLPARGTPLARARAVLAPVLAAAWRRPVTQREVTPYARLVHTTVAAGGSFRDGLRLAVEAALVSPHFLFRVEAGGLAPRARDLPPGANEPLDDHALAARLSYFLWSTLPDASLRAAADAGVLADPDRLATEAQRMLADERASALATNFAAQWLELRRLDVVEPDPARFPEFDAGLAASMRRETELLFDTVRREALPVRTLLAADFTFVDRRLARLYGLPVPPVDGFVRVPVGPARSGVLGHASVLTVTSNPTRTSPVKRGKWVLTNLLDDPPPAPPPGSDSFAGGEASVAVAASLREQLALHRRDARCSVCHDRMDALGLALENFDAVGRWRDSDGGLPIDASGMLPDGAQLTGPASLGARLADDPRFVRALLHKLFVYAVGRPVRTADELALEAASRDLNAGATLADLVEAIVRLDAFRMRTVVVR